MARATPDPAPPARSRQLALFDDDPAGGVPAPAPMTAPLPAVAPAPPPAAFGHPHAQHEIRLAGHAVGYALRRARRRSIGFVIGVEGLAVSAPRWVSVADIEQALKQKSRWILDKLQQQRERAGRLQAARVDWRDGVNLPYLGRPLTVRLDPLARGAVLREEVAGPDGALARTLHLGLPAGAAPAQIRDAVQSWLQRQARRLFEERCAAFAPRLGVRIQRLSLSSASTRWGSASASGAIRLNWRLVHFGLPVIDYVVTHELSHLREMNHSAAFWEVVRSVMPDYESARGALRHEVLPVFD